MGEAKSSSWFNHLDAATPNHVGSKVLRPDSNSDLFCPDYILQASGSQWGQFGTLRAVSSVWRHFWLSCLGRCCWRLVTIDNAHSSGYNKGYAGSSCQQWRGSEHLLLTSATQNAVRGPRVFPSLGSLLEMQNDRPSELETLGAGPRNTGFHKPPRSFLHTQLREAVL